MAASRPNIVIVLADDMGFSDIGCFGAEIATPTLDSLAADGVRCTQMYNAARCCPSRACLLTGLYPHQAGIGAMVGDDHKPGYRGFLGRDTVTLAEALRPAGYRTILSGKWHVGGEYTRGYHAEAWRREIGNPVHPTPRQRGFDRSYGILAGAANYFNPPTLHENDQLLPPPQGDYYFTDAITDHAIREVRSATADRQPFFLYLAHIAPHWPLHALPEDIARYRDRYRAGWDALRDERYARLRALGLLDAGWPLSPRDPGAKPWSEAALPEWEALRMAVYAAQIDRLDQSLGRLVAELKRLGQYENTLIAFVSDNGGCAEFLREDGEADKWPGFYAYPLPDGRPVVVGNHPGREPGPGTTFMSYDLPWANASNTPFRRFKSYVHEGGIATPAVFCWPAGLPAGRITHGVGHFLDFMPTCLELAGAAYPATFADTPILPAEGHSLLPLLRGEAVAERTLCWEHFRCRAIRTGDWKLVHDRQDPDERWELYHLPTDRTELNDRSAAEPDRVARMRQDWQTWAQRVGV
jgi:arylsulfatase